MTTAPGEIELTNLSRLLKMAREEDLGTGDVTSDLLGKGGSRNATAAFITREELVVCAAAMLPEIADAYDGNIRTEVLIEEGALATAGSTIARWSGPAGAILAAERVALNFLQRLCGIATLTRRYVDMCNPVKVYDTRKTLPGWRALSKYAVRCGGGMNHRMGLYDAILVKDNHVALLGEGSGTGLDALRDVLGRAATELGEGGFVEVEVDTLSQLETALELPVDIILLDNMSCRDMTRAAAMRDRAGLAGKVALEASGGVTLETARAAADSGVDRIAIGAITHSAAAVDIGLDIVIE